VSNSENETGLWAQNAVHLAKQARNVSFGIDLMHTDRKVDNCVHEESEVSKIAFVEFHYDV
jgi:hypothetical protein